MTQSSMTTQYLWAKKDRSGKLRWLPLVMHVLDSAAVARLLWRDWVPVGVKNLIQSNLISIFENKINNAIDDDYTERYFVFLAAAHDLGKATPVFQSKGAYPHNLLDELLLERQISSGLPMPPDGEKSFQQAQHTPHALATHILLEQAGCNEQTAVVLGAHHGKPPSRPMLVDHGIEFHAMEYHLKKQGKDIWRHIQSSLLDYVLEASGIQSVQQIFQPKMNIQVLLSGLVIMVDWIASNDTYFPYIDLDDEWSELLKPENHKKRSQSGWAELRLPKYWRPGTDCYGDGIYNKRFGSLTRTFSPYPMQTEVFEIACAISEPGIFVLEAPMGSGKSEAALVAAEVFALKAERSGIFFALPTQATSDGIFPRVNEWAERLDQYGKHSIRLAHGKAQFNEQYQNIFDGSRNIGSHDENGSGMLVHQWFEGSKKSLLADFVVGTIDQLLMLALKQKHVMLRHLGLANKVVIIDECHAYDAYMSQYLERALNWLGSYKVPVIVLSATLPLQKRQQVVNAYIGKVSASENNHDSIAWQTMRNYPLLTWTDGHSIHSRALTADAHKRQVVLSPLEDDEVTGILSAMLSDGGCAGIILNTVQRAQDLASFLREQFGAEKVELIHSRFLTPVRATKEKRLREGLGKPGTNKQRPSFLIVVGTQVLEQSLDIDFDVLITDLCPMDLLLQRIGRLHRHERVRPLTLCEAKCMILGWHVDGFEPGAKAVYGEYLLTRTRNLLPQSICLPDDIPQLVQDVYDDSVPLPKQPDGYAMVKAEWDNACKNRIHRANTFRVDPPAIGPRDSMISWLLFQANDSEKAGEATVRDSDESIEVLLIQLVEGDFLLLSPGNHHLPISHTQVPDEKLAREMACQTIRLPHSLCLPWNIKQTIDELEYMNRILRVWQNSPWLNGELFLILDYNGTAHLNGCRLVYNTALGLQMVKENDQHAK